MKITWLRGVVPDRKSTIFAFSLYILSIILLFFYSFTQIDLSLTLTKIPWLLPLQQAFQWVGYFNRPLSSFFYSGIILLLFLSYSLLLKDATRGILKNRTVWFLIIFATVLLIFAYNAFSYDLFNYIFDAKIITHYHENPYLKKALDYQGDPMLSFMHWTERVYPYGPAWLVFTVPLSLLGIQYFVVTFFLFKIAIGATFIGTCYFLQKIAKKIHSETNVSSLVFFALNPLLIIESLVSAHNDIVMLFFVMVSLWYLLEQKTVNSVLSFVFSVGIKFATGILLPVYLYIGYKIRKGQAPNWGRALSAIVTLMLIAMLLATNRTNFQPWYFLYALPFVALLVRRVYLVVPAILFSFGSLLQYLPFLYLGNYNAPVPFVLSTLFISTGLISLVVGVILRLKLSRS